MENQFKKFTDDLIRGLDLGKIRYEKKRAELQQPNKSLRNLDRATQAAGQMFKAVEKQRERALKQERSAMVRA